MLELDVKEEIAALVPQLDMDMDGGDNYFEDVVPQSKLEAAE